MRARSTRRWAGALFLTCALLGCSKSGPSKPLSALLITLDTTRADVLGAYGGPKGVTPALDELAQSSICYTQARTVLPFTLPAHASMLTGFYPPRHGVRDNAPQSLPAEATTLAELAQRAGYQTAAFVASSTLDRAWGLAQGFDTWSQPAGESALEARRAAERPAREVAAEALAWLERRDTSRPFFLWVHFFDAHQPYEPEPRFLLQGGGSPYRGEVAAMDASVGALLARLAELGLLESTAVLAVGDHGEGLGDHGEATHGYFAWDSTLRVPFLVRHPDGWRAGESSAETVSVADVFPTLLDALGLPPAPGVDGFSLWRRIVPRERRIYFEALGGWVDFGWSALCGASDERGKYMHSSRPALFDPRSDPREERDRIAELGGEVEAYRASLREVLARPALARQRAGADAPLEALARLGYATGRSVLLDWPDPLADSDRPSPLDRAAECQEYLEAREQLGSGQIELAIPRLESLVVSNPLNVAALDELGTAWIARGEWQRAVEVLLRRAELLPPRVTTHKDLMRCYMELGQDIPSREQYLKTLELMIGIATDTGDGEKARALTAIYEHEALELQKKKR
jgi:arylsulfatase A-like enzyme